MQIIMNKRFIKLGNRIMPTPEGIDYELSLDKAYKLKFDTWEGRSFLEEVNLPIFPEKCYTKTMDRFTDKVLINFNNIDNKNLGILLTGLKGSGKTLTAKRLAIRSGIPIIIVDEKYPADRLVDFFSKVKQEVCIIFDEIDKNIVRWNSTKLLTFLDGVENTCKKLIIFTCNDTKFANENLIDRCSRIRYFKTYNGLNDKEVKAILDDLLLYQDKREICEKCIKTINVKSYDNIISFITEVNNYRDEDPMELLEDLNINTKQ